MLGGYSLQGDVLLRIKNSGDSLKKESPLSINNNMGKYIETNLMWASCLTCYVEYRNQRNFFWPRISTNVCLGLSIGVTVSIDISSICDVSY